MSLEFDRVCSFKVAMKGVGKDMAKYLNDFKFGVGVSGGRRPFCTVSTRC